jgi:hypothetical protein
MHTANLAALIKTIRGRSRKARHDMSLPQTMTGRSQSRELRKNSASGWIDFISALSNESKIRKYRYSVLACLQWVKLLTCPFHTRVIVRRHPTPFSLTSTCPKYQLNANVPVLALRISCRYQAQAKLIVPLHSDKQTVFSGKLSSMSAYQGSQKSSVRLSFQRRCEIQLAYSGGDPSSVLDSVYIKDGFSLRVCLPELFKFRRNPYRIFIHIPSLNAQHSVEVDVSNQFPIRVRWTATIQRL